MADPWWRRAVEGKADEEQPAEAKPAELPPPPVLCPRDSCRKPIRRGLLACSAFGASVPADEVDLERPDIVDVDTYAPVGHFTYRNIPEAMRRQPNYQDVERVYGWRPWWR
jgi:hypothetical protein